MEPGDRFDPTGYEVMAHANTDYGQIQILSNNSNYFHVVEYNVAKFSTVILLKSYRYSGDQPKYYCFEAYEYALFFMVNSALSRTESLKE